MSEIQNLNELALKKYKLFKEQKVKFIARSVMAGVYLGFAIIISYCLGSLFYSYGMKLGASLAPALTFGVGLVAICLLGGELFTGNCLFISIPVFCKKLKIKDALNFGLVNFITNSIGVIFICLFFVNTNVFNDFLHPYLENLTMNKLSVDLVHVFLRAILCNWIVCIAGYSNYKINGDFGNIFLIFFFVFMFVLPGFEHSVANVGIFSISQLAMGAANIVDVFIHTLICVVGNVIGGSLMGLLLYFMDFNGKGEQ